jgi:hypothetical protein
VPLSRRTKLIWLVVLAAGSSYYYFGLLLPRVRTVRSAQGLYGPNSYGGDFYPIWLTTRELLALRTNPYTPGMTRHIQLGLYGRLLSPLNPYDPPPNYRAFSYPLYVDLLAAPCAGMAFSGVQLIGAFLGPLLLAGSVILWSRALRIPPGSGFLAVTVVLTLTSYAGLESLYALQPALGVSFFLAAGMAALRSGKLALAGVFLALAAIKPHLIVILAVALILWGFYDWNSRKGLLAGFGATLLLLVVASSAIIPRWLEDWWRALQEYRQYTEPPLVQLVLGKFAGGIAAVLLLALAGKVCWMAVRESVNSSRFWLAVAMVLAVTVALLPTGGAVYDQLILLPGFLWIYGPGIDRGQQSKARLGWMGLLVLSWQWLAALAVVLAAVLWTGLRDNEFAIVLPLRTAAALPFVVLALLFLAAVNFGTNRRIQPLPSAG